MAFHIGYYAEGESYACTDEPEIPDSGTSVDIYMSERKNYDRLFWTRGLIAAARAGNEDALPLLRRMYDWFNSCEYLPYMLRGSNATNGLPCGGLVYHTAIGRPEDIAVSRRWFDQDCWLNDLAAREPDAFAFYPGNRPHCYDLLGLEAFADEYRATGDRRYLDALLGGWDVYRSGCKHIGGAAAICEADGPYPYKSYYITTGHNGETCGSVFWIWVNSRLMQLYPEEEKYAAEIEEALFNVICACRDDRGYTRYHNRLVGEKETAVNENTCCEVSSSLLLGELPQYIYMTDAAGVWINLFVPSEFCFGGLRIGMQTQFPYDGAVCLSFGGESCVMTVRVRIPCWTGRPVALFVNGVQFVEGAPGAYVSLTREWSEDDELTFALPMPLVVKEYDGADISDSGKSGMRFFAARS